MSDPHCNWVTSSPSSDGSDASNPSDAYCDLNRDSVSDVCCRKRSHNFCSAIVKGECPEGFQVSFEYFRFKRFIRQSR